MIGDPCIFLCLKSRFGLIRFISIMLSELGKSPFPWPHPPGHELVLAPPSTIPTVDWFAPPLSRDVCPWISHSHVDADCGTWQAVSLYAQCLPKITYSFYLRYDPSICL